MYKMLVATFTTSTNSATPTSHAKRASVIGTLPRKCLTDQHSTAGRAPSRVGITRTVPPGRSVAVRGYAAVDAGAAKVALLERAKLHRRDEQTLLSGGSSNDGQPAQVAARMASDNE